MAIHKLTPRKVATAGPGKYEDGGGLRLVVSGSGTKKWVLRFTINDKRREMGFGSYPDVGLAAARIKAAECRQQAAVGVDPIEARRTEPEKVPTFTTCAARYLRAHRHGWKNAKHPVRYRPSPATSPRWPWPMSSRTRLKPPIGAAICSPSAAR